MLYLRWVHTHWIYIPNMERNTAGLRHNTFKTSGKRREFFNFNYIKEQMRKIKRVRHVTTVNLNAAVACAGMWILSCSLLFFFFFFFIIMKLLFRFKLLCCNISIHGGKSIILNDWIINHEFLLHLRGFLFWSIVWFSFLGFFLLA